MLSLASNQPPSAKTLLRSSVISFYKELFSRTCTFGDEEKGREQENRRRPRVCSRSRRRKEGRMDGWMLGVMSIDLDGECGSVVVCLVLSMSPSGILNSGQFAYIPHSHLKDILSSEIFPSNKKVREGIRMSSIWSCVLLSYLTFGQSTAVTRVSTEWTHHVTAHTALYPCQMLIVAFSRFPHLGPCVRSRVCQEVWKLMPPRSWWSKDKTRSARRTSWTNQLAVSIHGQL